MCRKTQQRKEVVLKISQNRQMKATFSKTQLWENLRNQESSTLGMDELVFHQPMLPSNVRQALKIQA